MGLLSFFGLKAARANDPKQLRGKSVVIKQGVTRYTQREYGSMAREAYQNNVIAYRCIHLIALAVASIPFDLSRSGKTLDNHPLLKLLNNPNPKQGKSEFIYAAVAQLIIGGNTFLDAVAPKPLAQPVELFVVTRPDRMNAQLDQFGEVMRWDYTPASQYEQNCSWDVGIVGDSDLLHIKSWHPTDNLWGMSPLTAAMSSIDQHNSAGDWNQALLDNSGTPSGVLYYEPREGFEGLSDAQYSRLKTELDEQILSKSNNRPLLLEGGLKWQQISVNPKDLEFLNGKNVSAGEICAGLGVPAQLVGLEGSQTYANYEQARLSFYEDTVIQIANMFAARLNNWLVPRYDAGLLLSFNYDALDVMQLKKQQMWARLEGTSFLTINEKRKAVGYNPIDGGDELYMPMNLLPLGADIPTEAPSPPVKKK